jgi:hypothetical protein
MYFVFDENMNGPRTYILILSCCFANACGLFETRTPEKPTTGSSTFIPPTTPDVVLMNLRSAVSEMNTENYMRCLVDTMNSPQRFQFIPAAAAAGRYPTIFAGWSLQSERSYFSSLKAIATDRGTSSLQLAGSFSLIGADSAIYNGDYTLTIPHGLTGVTETVRGNVQFTLALNRSSFWNITAWTDTPVANEVSWSEWKGRFAN